MRKATRIRALWPHYSVDATLARPAQQLLYGTTRRYAEFVGAGMRQAYTILQTDSMHVHRCNSAFAVTLEHQAYRVDYAQHISDVRRDAGITSGKARCGELIPIRR